MNANILKFTAEVAVMHTFIHSFSEDLWWVVVSVPYPEVPPLARQQVAARYLAP